jgi:exopolysaccharide production protein ExoZ
MFISLQYVRGIAALLVVYFHAVIQLNHSGRAPVDFLLLGESGVDLFFVLSGFVMWITTYNKKISPFNFFKKRLLRVAPIYWLLTIISATIALVVPHLLKSTVFDVEHLIYSLLFIPHLNPANNGDIISPVIIPGWTLNFEMFFYFVFALCLFIKPLFIRLLTVTLIMLLLFLMSFLYKGANVVFEFYFNAIIIEFLFGVLVGVLLTNNVAICTISRLLPLTLLFFSSLLLLFNDAFSSFPRFIALGLPAFIVIYACVLYENNYCVPRIEILKFMGDSSYSIYLTHIFVIAGSRVLFSQVGITLDSINPFFYVLFCIVFSALVGGAFYLMIEKKLSKLLN